MVTETPNHGFRKWADDEEPWEQRGEWDDLEVKVELRGPDADKSNYTAHDNALYRATDTDTIYIGDGSSWNEWRGDGAVVTDGDNIDRSIWVISAGGSDPVDATADDLIFEEEP